ncbi:hypothetical protein CUJ89_18645 [Burkholderia pyrrocinia]|uniref:Uncharacterized protein n=1 Tax=Burkholderia pyrrocinia TaxID=60550 RepID=A0A2Z5MZ10_BURPY|nr:hypothetical protein CUJ89_18645 [Burkholderia pyrrocinia]
MLTICRQCRLPKGVRKPVVGPVACYRGAEGVVVPIACPVRGDSGSACRRETAREARTVGPASAVRDAGGAGSPF